MSTQHTPLDEFEMFELLQAAYPEKFKEESDETWESVMQFAEEFEGLEQLCDLLGRVVMLTNPMTSGLTRRVSHCLGRVTIREGAVDMVAAVRRDAIACDATVKGVAA